MSRKGAYKAGIKPCPKCKSRGRLNLDVSQSFRSYSNLHRYQPNLKLFYFVSCMNCGYAGPRADERHKAIRAWNDTVYNQNLIAKRLEEMYEQGV